MGIREVVSAARSPWQNPYVERVIGSLRRECLDYTVIFNERHLRRVLSTYIDYYWRAPPEKSGELPWSSSPEGDGQMKGSRYSEEQIIGILREAEAGLRTAEVCRRHRIAEATLLAGIVTYRNLSCLNQDAR
jgi:hypothetical protein